MLVAFNALTIMAGRQERHPACKKWGNGGGGHWLVRMEWRPAGWSVCLPLLISSCTVKSRSSLLAPAQPGCPGKITIKRLCYVLIYVNFCHIVIVNSQPNKVKTQVYQGDTDASDSQKFVPYMSAPPLRTGEF